ncbi:MAG: hypothetical protein HY676_02080 [Chloroflexi bacterium]|nr:hypothetical protein [Chloroflexota bacterium]
MYAVSILVHRRGVMMKRVFGDTDRIKKMVRVPAKNTPGAQAQAGAPAGLVEAIRGSLADGFLPCAAAFGIAKKLKIPLVVVGDAADDIGVRVVNCQLGCFKVDKSVHDLVGKTVRPELAAAVESHIANGSLTCADVFGLARRLKVRPIEIADAANQSHTKIHHCQLGCF